MEAFTITFLREQCAIDGKGWCLTLGDTDNDYYTVIGFYRSPMFVADMVIDWGVSFTLLYPKGEECEHPDFDVREDTCVCYECGRIFALSDVDDCDCESCQLERDYDEDETI